MTLQEIKSKLSELAKKHAAIDENGLDDFEDAELLELNAEKLIITYCEERGYLINGFPTEKRKLDEDELDDEDYFCRERFLLYLDILTYQKEDVAELTWHYANSFWPSTFESKEDYVAQAKERADDDSFYEVTL